MVLLVTFLVTFLVITSTSCRYISKDVLLRMLQYVFRKHSDEDQRKFDGAVGGVPGDHQHQLLGCPRLLLLGLAHHQEEPRHQADKNVLFQQPIECFIRQTQLLVSTMVWAIWVQCSACLLALYFGQNAHWVAVLCFTFLYRWVSILVSTVMIIIVAKSKKCSTDSIFDPKNQHPECVIYDISKFAVKQRKCL